MKISTFASSLALTVVSLSSAANTVVFKPVNNNLETQACYLAATKGLDAVKELVRGEDQNYIVFKSALSCNGYSLTSFADKYKPEVITANEATQPTVTLVAKDDTPESKICVDALVLGEQAARQKYDVINTEILCNLQELGSFVRKYSKENVVVRNTSGSF